jgi:hypothetical protein
LIESGEVQMAKKPSKRKERQGKNLSLIKFCDTYNIPSNFGVDSIPVKHPQTGEKIYLIGSVMMEQWYRKKPGQSGKDGQMWPLMQGLGFDIANIEIHDDIVKELDGVGSFTRTSSIKE